MMQRLVKELYVPWVTLQELKRVRAPEKLAEWTWRDVAIQHRLNTATDSFSEILTALLDLLHKLALDDTHAITEKDMVSVTSLCC
jgi:hypothetical protein